MNINIIHLPHRIDRLALLQIELANQNITQYTIWSGIVDSILTCRGISSAHKQIVQYAFDRNLPEILIGEDDLHFTSNGAFNYFLDNKPEKFDLYLASIYEGHIKKDKTVTDFSGLTFYIISSGFYETFLNIPDHLHIDRALNGTGNFFVCQPFPVIQHDGFSDNYKTFLNYSKLFSKTQLFNGKGS